MTAFTITWADKEDYEISALPPEQKATADDWQQVKDGINNHAQLLDEAHTVQGIISFSYKFQTSTNPPPGSGKVRLNNATQDSSTKMYVSKTDELGEEIGDLLTKVINEGDSVVVFDRRATSHNKAFIIDTITDQTDYFEYDVTFVSSSGADFSNQDRLRLAWFTAVYTGDMEKAVYDTNDNGIVDNSEQLGAQLPAYYDQNAHVADMANPHGVTKAQVGLGNVDNTSDLNKPVSTAQQTEIDTKEDAFSKNTAFNKNFGTTGTTVAFGDHLHTGVYEPANSNIQAHIADNTIHFTQAQISIPASQISDFDTEVSNNSSVVANTAKVSYTDAALVAKLAAEKIVKALTIEAPVLGDNIAMFFTDQAITIEQVNDVIRGSSSVSWNLYHAATRNAAGNKLFTTDRATSTLSGAETTVFADATIPAGSWIWLQVSASNVAVTQLNTTITYTID